MNRSAPCGWSRLSCKARLDSGLFLQNSAIPVQRFLNTVRQGSPASALQVHAQIPVFPCAYCMQVPGKAAYRDECMSEGVADTAESCWPLVNIMPGLPYQTSHDEE